MRKSTLRLQPRKACLVRRFQTESCSYAVSLERYETIPAVLSLSMSLDAEFAAVVLTGLFVGEPQVLDARSNGFMKPLSL